MISKILFPISSLRKVPVGSSRNVRFLEFLLEAIWPGFATSPGNMLEFPNDPFDATFF